MGLRDQKWSGGLTGIENSCEPHSVPPATPPGLACLSPRSQSLLPTGRATLHLRTSRWAWVPRVRGQGEKNGRWTSGRGANLKAEPSQLPEPLNDPQHTTSPGQFPQGQVQVETTVGAFLSPTLRNNKLGLSLPNTPAFQGNLFLHLSDRSLKKSIDASAESLCCPPETITTLLIGYISI